MSEEQASSTKRGRSPAYPYIDLGEAVDRLRELRNKEGRHPVPWSAAFAAWGYEGTKGDGNLVASALRKFGLLDYQGSGTSRRVQITPLGLKILEHPDAKVRADAIKEAALNPAIHAELWSEHKDVDQLPSDNSLRWDLVHDRNFTDSGADGFIPVYRATLKFAGMMPSGTVEPQDELSDDQLADLNGGSDDEEAWTRQSSRESDTPPGPPRSTRERQRGMVAITVPLKGFPADQPAVLEFPGKLDRSQWDYFMRLLAAMEDGVVEEDRSAVAPISRGPQSG
jgi:hypothetical protein